MTFSVIRRSESYSRPSIDHDDYEMPNQKEVMDALSESPTPATFDKLMRIYPDCLEYMREFTACPVLAKSITKNYLEVVKHILHSFPYLCNSGASVRGGQLPQLVVAAKNGRFEIVEMLLNLGADINLASRCGLTALRVAVAMRNLLLTRYLQIKGGVIYLKQARSQFSENYKCVMRAIKEKEKTLVNNYLRSKRIGFVLTRVACKMPDVIVELILDYQRPGLLEYGLYDYLALSRAGKSRWKNRLNTIAVFIVQSTFETLVSHTIAIVIVEGIIRDYLQAKRVERPI